MKRLWSVLVLSLVCVLPVSGGDAADKSPTPKPLTTVHFDEQIFGNTVTFNDAFNPGATTVNFNVPAFFNKQFVAESSNSNTIGFLINDATNCTNTACALIAVSASTQSQTAGIGGFSTATGAPNYGVFGAAVGTASSLLSTDNSAGVRGLATAETGAVSGVQGQVRGSSGSKAAGVYGTADNAAANGGAFQNTGSAGLITAFLATSVNGTNYALFSSNGGIKAASLSITGAKSFIAPDPEDPSKEIQYVSVEAPTSDVYFRGSARLENGEAVIAVPDHFRLTAREGSYMATVTPVGSPANLYVESQDAKGIVVRGAGHAAFNYVVYAERDLARNNRPLRPNVDFTPEAIEKGGGPAQLAPRLRELLVRNGTLNPDGTYRQDTADKLGWRLPEMDDTNR